MEDLRPVIRGFLPPVSGEILRANAQRIFCHHPEPPRIPGIHEAVNSLLDRARAGYVSSELEDHRTEDDEPLSVSVALSKSREFCGQSVHKAPPESITWCVVMPYIHERRCSPPG